MSKLRLRNYCAPEGSNLGIMINESFNGLVNPPLRGGWKTNNREQSKKTTSYN